MQQDVQSRDQFLAHLMDAVKSSSRNSLLIEVYREHLGLDAPMRGMQSNHVRQRLV